MPEQFDEAYVKKLREENASWRTKVRELEANQLTSEVEVELARQGIEADPGWVRVEEGQSVADAVSKMVEQFPNLKKEVVEPAPEIDFGPESPKVTPRPIAPSTPRSTTPKPARTTKISSRNIEEIKKDPVARAKVRDHYRSLLAAVSNQPGD